jgi:predicted branched-subunit amino acid permease
VTSAQQEQDRRDRQILALTVLCAVFAALALFTTAWFGVPSLAAGLLALNLMRR